MSQRTDEIRPIDTSHYANEPHYPIPSQVKTEPYAHHTSQSIFETRFYMRAMKIVKTIHCLRVK